MRPPLLSGDLPSRLGPRRISRRHVHANRTGKGRYRTLAPRATTRFTSRSGVRSAATSQGCSAKSPGSSTGSSERRRSGIMALHDKSMTQTDQPPPYHSDHTEVLVPRTPAPERQNRKTLRSGDGDGRTEHANQSRAPSERPRREAGCCARPVRARRSLTSRARSRTTRS